MQAFLPRCCITCRSWKNFADAGPGSVAERTGIWKTSRGHDCEGLYTVEHRVDDVHVRPAQDRCRIRQNITVESGGRTRIKLRALLKSKWIFRVGTIISPRFSNAEITQGIQSESNRRTNCTVKFGKATTTHAISGGCLLCTF